MLATSEEAEEVAWRRGQGAHPRPVVEFGYDMDNEAGSNICAGKWGAAMTGNTIRQGSNSQDNDERDDVEGDESEEDDDENNQGSSSDSDEESNNNRYKRSGGGQLGAHHNKRRK